MKKYFCDLCARGPLSFKEWSSLKYGFDLVTMADVFMDAEELDICVKCKDTLTAILKRRVLNDDSIKQTA